MAKCISGPRRSRLNVDLTAGPLQLKAPVILDVKEETVGGSVVKIVLMREQ